jgi:hypothetical protein
MGRGGELPLAKTLLLQPYMGGGRGEVAGQPCCPTPGMQRGSRVQAGGKDRHLLWRRGGPVITTVSSKLNDIW